MEKSKPSSSTCDGNTMLSLTGSIMVKVALKPEILRFPVGISRTRWIAKMPDNVSAIHIARASANCLRWVNALSLSIPNRKSAGMFLAIFRNLYSSG
jgi:hypothetical protein